VGCNRDNFFLSFFLSFFFGGTEIWSHICRTGTVPREPVTSPLFAWATGAQPNKGSSIWSSLLSMFPVWSLLSEATLASYRSVEESTPGGGGYLEDHLLAMCPSFQSCYQNSRPRRSIPHSRYLSRKTLFLLFHLAEHICMSHNQDFQVLAKSELWICRLGHSASSVAQEIHTWLRPGLKLDSSECLLS
jgi:hypothetical protein